MGVNYLQLKRMCALRLAQIKGTSQSTLEAAYTGAWTTALDGAEIPKTAFCDQIVAIGGEIAQIIGANASHPYRSYIVGYSAPLSDLDSTPVEDAGGSPFVGVFDGFADDSTNRPCTWQPLQTIADIVDNAPGFFDPNNYYYYNINAQVLRTTRSSGKLSGCVWDAPTQRELCNGDADSPLPYMVTNMWVNGVCASSVQVGWTDQAGAAAIDSQLYEQGKQLLMMGAQVNIPLASQANPIAG